MDVVYILQHCYENADGYEEIKMIGVYSTEQNAKEAIGKLGSVSGFAEHTKDCFYIDEYRMNETHWIDGFVTV